MVSHHGFRILGYLYASLVIMVSILHILLKIGQTIVVWLGKSKLNQIDASYSLGFLISLVFSVILLVGIRENNLTMVKIYRIYLKVTSISGIVCFAIAILVMTVMIILTDGKTDFVIILIILLAVFALLIGYYLFFIWIINGVVDAVQSKQQSNDLVPHNVGNQQDTSKLSPA